MSALTTGPAAEVGTVRISFASLLSNRHRALEALLGPRFLPDNFALRYFDVHAFRLLW